MPHATDNPRKRSRCAAGDEDHVENVLEVREATSGLRGNARKRPRLSDSRTGSKRRLSERNGSAGPDGGDDDGDDDDDRNNGEEETPPAKDEDVPDASPLKTQYEMLRDGNFEHLEHEDEHDLRARQRLEKKTWSLDVERMGDNHTAENGVLESITCVNFMCHKHLHCELGPLLNFIVGENGSGKSAILTAITLCLGGKATSTNRGGSLKSFIKEGCERAALIVKIKNQGSDAFCHDIYGDTIIVERAFSKTGSSGFKVKTATGQTHSTKKAEVDEIVEHFGMQVDNPLNVLSQDNARQFLSTSTKEQKYRFFYEGVLLAQLDKDYQIVQETVELIESKIPDQQERLKRGEKDVASIKKLKQALEGNRHLFGHRHLLQQKVTWAQVAEQERRLAACEEQVQESEAKIADAEKELEQRQKIFEERDQDIVKAEAAIEAARDDAKECQRQEDLVREGYTRTKDECTNIHNQERDARSAGQQAKSLAQDVEAKIEIERKRLEDAAGSGHAKLLEELAAEKKSRDDRQDEIADQKRLEASKASSFQGLRETMSQAKSVADAKKREVDTAKRHVQQLASRQVSQYAGYEAGMQRLRAEIDRDNGFSAKPIGPVGSHMQLLKPEWLPILESLFGKQLNGFVVGSMNDQRRLQEMMTRMGIHHSPIIVARNVTIDTDGKEPDPQFDTVLRVLKIDNEMVRNQLIINHSIEQIILVADRGEADRVMFHERGPPRNVKACLALNKHRPGCGFRIQARASGGSTAPIEAPRGRFPRIIADSASQITLARASLQQLEADEAELRNKEMKAVAEVRGRKSELEKLVANRTRLERLLHQTRARIERIEEKLDGFDGADGRLLGLQEQHEELIKKMDFNNEQAAELFVQKEGRNKELDAALNTLKGAKANVEEAKRRIMKAEGAAEKARRTREAKLKELNKVVDGLKALQRARDEAADRRAATKGDVDDFTNEASKHFPHRVAIAPNETYASLNKQLHATEQQLKAAQAKAGMTEEEAEARLAEARERRDQYRTGLLNTQLVNDRLKKSLNVRLERWRYFLCHISARSRQTFIFRLSNRGFTGKLSFDHKRRRLDLHVEPHKDERQHRGPARNTKTLSGGEKSFSSICLLLSIWDAMNSPLRCLDEFDVFMDNVNRAISTKMLIDAARMSTNRQFIFITPNAIEGQQQNLGKDVKIIRLTDPRQRRLTDL